MGGDASRREVLLAVALGSRRKRNERRVFPDRRSGIDRRKTAVAVPYERRFGSERRQVVRRETDRDDGPTLLQKARNRLRGRSPEPSATEDSEDGLR
jgi:hypothetical protein